MKLSILTIDNKNTGKVDMPPQFDEQVRPDVIERAAEALRSTQRQPYGAFPEAGKRSSSWVSKQRRSYRGCYGHGISRVPRKVHSRSGTNMNWVGAFAPGCVGGRRAHPPKPWKIWARKINKKENRFAVRSALAATVNKEMVKSRGHRVPDAYPFIISTEFEKITKAHDLEKALLALGLEQELVRCAIKKVRAGRGKGRGRKYKQRRGPLVVISGNAPIERVNLPGIDVARVDELNAVLLAPGAPGRLTLYTEAAVERLRTEHWFMNDFKGKSAPRKEETTADTGKKQEQKKEHKQVPKAKAQPKEKQVKQK
ncbi:MAG: 50S ribosomal protein L4 [Candidatus Woesearchaeota archaeon]|nr:50S ribosomal protein L4 [Candidatus Woesearchaeota archaeon]